jgi:FMN phosphatase YigB (HAD superfamily)
LLIRAITFDFWNTLFVAVSADDIRCGLLKEASERAGYASIAEGLINRAIACAWQEWDRVWLKENRTFGADHWVSLVLGHLGVSLAEPDEEALIHAVAASGMQADPPLVDGLAALLPRLAQRYRLGVICDTGLSPGWMLRDCMEKHGILQYFSHLTFSDELGVSKPHADAFLSTLAGLGVSAEMAVHIGDYPRTDIAGARSVGMRAIHFTGVYDWGDGTVPADARIASYSELEPLLRRWRN